MLNSHSNDCLCVNCERDRKTLAQPTILPMNPIKIQGWNGAIDACIALTESTWPEADDLVDAMKELRRQ